MGGLFSSPTPKMAQQPPDLKGVKVQQSAYGLCVPIVYGTNRLAGDVIWLGKTQAIAQSDSQQSGGKGGQPQQTSQTKYDYRVALAIGLCEGPIVGLGAHWRNKKKYPDVGAWTVHTGALTQSPEGWLSTKHPDAALNYPGQAYVFKDSLDLGSSPNLPNISFEVKGFLIYGSGIVDALPSDIIPDFLSNAYYGVGLPSGLIGSLTQLRNYCLSAGIFISPILSEQKTAADGLNEILTACNTRAVYSGGVLNFVPMGDSALSGNGATFTPNLTPVADITDDDLAPGPPIAVQRKDQADAYNDVRVEYADRTHDYNAAIAEARDDGAVAFYGLRAQSPIQAHAITTAKVAQFLAQLTVQQNASNLNTYTFTLSPKWILLDPLDIITLTDSRVGLSKTKVRLTAADEQPDGTFQCTAEDLSEGSYTVQGFGTEPQGGLIPNENADPGNCNAPVIWESTPAFTDGKKELCVATSGVALSGTLAVVSGVSTWSSADVFTLNQLMGRTLQDSAGIQWPLAGNTATSGGSTVLTLLPGAVPAAGAAKILPDTWGGCNVWVSRDGSTYKMLGTLNGPCRHGVLHSTLASSSNVYPTPDTTHTLAADLALSQGTMASGIQDDADLLGTLCWVDGEYLSYETAALVSGNLFNLTYLQRGVFDSAATSHATNSKFVVLDSAVGRFDYKLEKGKTIYVKLQAFNAWGNAPQDLSTLTPTTYVVQGLTIAGLTGLTRTETKRRRNIFTATFAANRALRKMHVYRRDYSATPGTPDTDPTNWVKYDTMHLATPQADGSQACVITSRRFSVSHLQDAQENVAVCLEDAFYQKSGWTVDSGATPADTDDTAPAIPTLALSSVVNDKTGTAKKECDFTVTASYVACHDLDIDLVEYDPSAGKIVNQLKSHHAVKDGASPFTHTWKRWTEKGNTIYARVRGKVGTAYSAWSCLDGSSAWNHLPPVGAYSIAAGGGSPLTVTLGPSALSCVPGGTIQFTVTPGGGSSPYTLDLDYGDGGTHYPPSGAGTSATVFDATHGSPVLGPKTYSTAGTYVAIAKITDSAGAVVTSTPITILVTSTGIGGVPVPVLTADVTHGAPPLAVVFTRAASGGTGPYAWTLDYGDGTTPASGTGWNGASTALGSHSFSTAGTRTGILSVTDALGVTETTSITIFVGVPITPGSFAIGVGAFVSSVVKIPGSTASRCDATCPFTVANAVHAIATLSDGTKTHKVTAECSGGSGTFYWGPHFKRGATLTITSVELVNGQVRATVSSPANGTCTAGATAAPTPGVVTVGTVETKKRHNLYPLTFSADTALTWCEIWKGASGASGDPDSNPTAWKAQPPLKLFTRDANGDPVCNMTTAEANVRHTQDATIDVQFRLENVYGVKGAFVLSSGSAPGTSDDAAPTGVSCTAVSWEDDITGTPGKECDLEVTVSWTGDATSIEVQVDETRNSATRTHTRRKAFPKTTSSSNKIIWRRHFKRGTAVVIRAYATNGTAISTVSADVNHTVGAALPSVPAFNGLTVKQAKKQHTIFLPTWATAAGASEAYRQIEIEAPTLFDNGTSSSVGANTLTDSSKSWTVGALVGMLLITSAGVSYAITANTATQLTVSAGGATPAAGAYTVSRWDLAKTHNIKAVRNSGTCSLRVEHAGDYQQAQIRLRMMDSYDQYSAYYPTDATRGDVGTDLTWWSSPNPPGDGDNPMSSWPWIFNGATAFWDNTAKRIQVGNNGIAMLDVPLQKQAVKVSGNFGVSSWSYSAQFAIIDPITGNGYGVSVGSTSAVLSKYVAWSPSTLQTLSYAALASGDLEASLEIHANKVAMVIGNGQYRKDATDTTYRIKGWKLYSIMGATAGGNYMYISALSVKNGASYYDGVASSTLMAVTDANGFLSADSTKVTIGGTAQALSPMFTKVGAGIYFDGNYVRERDPVALASLPTTDLKAGMMLPVYDSGGSGAGKCKIAMYIPANFFGGSWPTSDTWFYTGMTATAAGSTGNTGTGGTGGTGGTCFTGDMEILTPDGPRKLEELEVGDVIVSIDQETGDQVEDRVAAVEMHASDAHLLLDGFLEVTEEHYLFGWDRGRPPASCPQHSAGVFPLGGLMWEYGLPPRARALSTKAVVNEPTPVYSLTTGTKCYWVGKGGTYILAHNLKNLDI